MRPDQHWEPPWRSIRDGDFQFIEWLSQTFPEHTVWREYYDLRTDPYELHNLLHDSTTGQRPAHPAPAQPARQGRVLRRPSELPVDA